jgi:hypothetical protein
MATFPRPQAIAPLGMAPRLDPILESRAGSGQRVKSFVSAERVNDSLRHRLGCFPVGERGPGHSYWSTSTGVRFQVDDPVGDSESAAVVRADGKQQLFYSYQYAYALLLYVSQLIIGRVAPAVAEPRAETAAANRASARTPYQIMNEFIEKRERAIAEMEAVLRQTKAEVERSKAMIGNLERQRETSLH